MHVILMLNPFVSTGIDARMKRIRCRLTRNPKPQTLGFLGIWGFSFAAPP